MALLIAAVTATLRGGMGRIGIKIGKRFASIGTSASFSVNTVPKLNHGAPLGVVRQLQEFYL